METSEQIITYWICPAEPARHQLAWIIGDLARRFGAPVFEPHVTIYSADAANENPEVALERVVKNRAQYALSIRGLDFSEEFTKTLFVQFAPDAELKQLSEDLRSASASPGDYQLNPHLSLIYKEMEEETKRRLAASITLPFTEVVFDTVKALLAPAEIKSRKEVEAWRIVAERKLTE
ncbi:MAG: 2'-5' RNA ligase family protein [Chthoniobacterales bacterium]